MKYPEVSAVIPSYNEDKTVGQTVRDIMHIPFITEIIVIDDGSTDNTQKILKPYKRKITLITNKQNKGKGYSVAKGVEKATGEIILLLDADIINYTARDLLLLVRPVAKHHYDYTIKSMDNKIITHFSGVRCYRRTDLLPITPQMLESTKYGLEVLLNKHFKDKRHMEIETRDHIHFIKFQKYNMLRAFWKYLIQWASIIAQTIKT